MSDRETHVWNKDGNEIGEANEKEGNKRKEETSESGRTKTARTSSTMFTSIIHKT